MIILDEQLNDPTLIKEIERCLGHVKVVKSGTKDENILPYLREEKNCDFITINFDDFWRKYDGDSRCTIICLELKSNKINIIPDIINKLFQLDQFSTINNRRGLVIKIKDNHVKYYKYRSAIPMEDDLQKR